MSSYLFTIICVGFYVCVHACVLNEEQEGLNYHLTFFFRRSAQMAFDTQHGS
jgi:hypothetical protein